jgi:hypothetical protein
MRSLSHVSLKQPSFSLRHIRACSVFCQTRTSEALLKMFPRSTMHNSLPAIHTKPITPAQRRWVICNESKN